MTLKNTENNAIINITNTSSGTEPVKTAGGFYKKDGCFYITYQEAQQSGMGASRVIVRAAPEGVTMRRMGEYRTVMEYISGMETELSYKTPYGDLTMKIKTHKIENLLSENGGRLSLKYRLTAGGEATENELLLKVELTGKEE